MSMPARVGVGRTRAASRHGVPRACAAAALALLALTVADVTAARAQSADNVLVLVNGTNDASRQIGDYYARRRGIPRERVLELNVPTAESISRENYVERIERPLARWLTSHSLQDHILYIVLTKGVPLRIAGTSGRNGTDVRSATTCTSPACRSLTARTIQIARIAATIDTRSPAIDTRSPTMYVRTAAESDP